MGLFFNTLVFIGIVVFYASQGWMTWLAAGAVVFLYIPGVVAAFYNGKTAGLKESRKIWGSPTLPRTGGIR